VAEENLWVVLPPEALEAEEITVWNDQDEPYVVGPTTQSIFYVPLPAAYSSYYWVSWY